MDAAPEQDYRPHMLKTVAVTGVAALTLSLVPSVHAAEGSVVASNRQPVPTLAMCVGAFLTGGPSTNANNITMGKRPSFVVVNCPVGGDDDPRSPTSDTYISDIKWKSWNRKQAKGVGTLNLPRRQCSLTSPQDGTPEQVQQMCQTGGDVTNSTVFDSFDVTFTLSRPRSYTHGKGKKKRTDRTFTRVDASFPDGGPHGQTSMTFKPPRKASE